MQFSHFRVVGVPLVVRNLLFSLKFVLGNQGCCRSWTRAGDDDDVMMGMGGDKMATRSKMINVDIEWPVYTSAFSKVPRQELVAYMALCLLPGGMINMDTLTPYVDSSNREAYIKSITVQLMSRPEYQLM